MKKVSFMIALALLMSVCLLFTACGGGAGGNPVGDAGNKPGDGGAQQPVEYTISVAELPETVAKIQADTNKKAIIHITDTAPDFKEDIGSIFYMNNDCWRCQITLDLSACTGVSEIAEKAFYMTDGLTGIILPDSIISLKKWSLSFSDFTSIEIPASVKNIDEAAIFQNLSLKEITVADGNEHFVSLNGCLLTADKSTMFVPEAYDKSTITVPKEVTHFAGYTVLGKLFNEHIESIENFNVETGNSVFTSVDGVLYNAEKSTLLSVPFMKESVTVVSGVTKLDDYCCYGCKKLKSILIPEGVKTIGDASFVSCDELTEITIPSTVTDIGFMFLYRCKKCKTLIMKGQTPPKQFIRSPFLEVVEDFTIKVPAASVETYKNWAQGYHDDLTTGSYKNQNDAAEDAELWLIIKNAIVDGGF